MRHSHACDVSCSCQLPCHAVPSALTAEQSAAAVHNHPLSGAPHPEVLSLLCCAALCCAAPCCAAPRCAVQCSAVQCCAVPCHAVSCCAVWGPCLYTHQTCDQCSWHPVWMRHSHCFCPCTALQARALPHHELSFAHHVVQASAYQTATHARLSRWEISAVFHGVGPFT